MLQLVKKMLKPVSKKEKLHLQTNETVYMYMYVYIYIYTHIYYIYIYIYIYNTYVFSTLISIAEHYQNTGTDVGIVKLSHYLKCRLVHP